jgi:hypothetical protein
MWAMSGWMCGQMEPREGPQREKVRRRGGIGEPGGKGRLGLLMVIVWSA